MSDYISREETIEELKKYHMTSGVSNQGTWNECVDVITHTVAELPSADVRENIHGHWEPKYPTREEIIYCQERYFCSNCKDYVVDRIARLEFNFCPNCGADMRGDE